MSTYANLYIFLDTSSIRPRQKARKFWNKLKKEIFTMKDVEEIPHVSIILHEIRRNLHDNAMKCVIKHG